MRVTAADVLAPEVVSPQPENLNALAEIFERASILLARTKMGVDRLKTVSFRDQNELFWEIHRIQKKLDEVTTILNEARSVQDAWDETMFQQEQENWNKLK